jgi:hypothetical protein
MLFLMRQPDLMGYMLPTRFWLDANHFAVAAVALLAGLVALLAQIKTRLARGRSGRSAGAIAIAVSLIVAAVAGGLMLAKIGGLNAMTRAAYSVFDLSLALVLLGAIAVAIRRATNPAAGSA